MTSRKVRYRRNKKLSEGSYIKVLAEKRSSNGCLTCRERHKKCDENRPICTGCQKNFLQCVWNDETPTSDLYRTSPAANMFLNFYLDELTVRNEKHKTIKKRRKKKKTCFHRSQTDDARYPRFHILTSFGNHVVRLDEKTKSSQILERFPTTKQLDSLDSCLESSWESHFHPSTSDSRPCTGRAVSTFRHIRNDVSTFSDATEDIDCHPHEEYTLSHKDFITLKRTASYSYMFDSSHELSQRFEAMIHLLNKGTIRVVFPYCKDELFLIYVAVNHWLVVLGPQVTHPLLTTQATFTRSLKNNAILKEVFMCCGATFLEYYDSKLFGQLSADLYQSSLTLIKNRLSQKTDEQAEPWLLASFQLLCLRNKTAINSTVNDCISCLTNSYHIINSPYYMAKIELISASKDTSVEENILQIEHNISSQTPVLEPHDRMYLESFIYNYSVALLWALDVSSLPNPYIVFDNLGKSLKCFIRQCDAKWMNNPVFGASLEAFEILAKASYIARLQLPLHDKSVWFERALQLQKQAYYYTPRIVPIYKQSISNGKIYRNCKVNLLAGKIVAKTCFLLITKVLHYTDFDLMRYQDTVTEIVKNMEQIPERNLTWGILTWSVVVCGVFAVDSYNQTKLLSFLDSIQDRFHMMPLSNAKLFLLTAWQSSLSERLEILFDRDYLTNVNA